MTTYAYIGDGLRVLQDDGVEETRVVYDGNNLVLEVDNVGAIPLVDGLSSARRSSHDSQA